MTPWFPTTLSTQPHFSSLGKPRSISPHMGEGVEGKPAPDPPSSLLEGVGGPAHVQQCMLKKAMAPPPPGASIRERAPHRASAHLVLVAASA